MRRSVKLEDAQLLVLSEETHNNTTFLRLCINYTSALPRNSRYNSSMSPSSALSFMCVLQSDASQSKSQDRDSSGRRGQRRKYWGRRFESRKEQTATLNLVEFAELLSLPDIVKYLLLLHFLVPYS